MFHQNIDGTQVQSSTKYFVIVGLVLLLVGMGYSVYLYKKASSPPAPEESSSKQQQHEKPVLSMQANGASPRVSAPPGYAAAFTGDGFTTHCMYVDGSEGIVGNKETPCKDGPMLYQYVRDTTGRPNNVTYKFVRSN